jgi:hypothetical protein
MSQDLLWMKKTLVCSSTQEHERANETRSCRMRICRAFISWYFCLYSLILIGVTIQAIWGAVQGQAPSHLLRFVLTYTSFSMAAAVYGNAWWSVWRKKSYGRRWAIAASLLSLLESTSALTVGLKAFEIWFVNFFWLPTVLGAVGLIVFLRSYDERATQSPG